MTKYFETQTGINAYEGFVCLPDVVKVTGDCRWTKVVRGLRVVMRRVWGSGVTRSWPKVAAPAGRAGWPGGRCTWWLP